MTPFRENMRASLRAHKVLALPVLAAALAVAAQTAWLRVPLGEIASFLKLTLTLLCAKVSLFFLVLGGFVAWRRGRAGLEHAAQGYFKSPLFAFGLIGAGLLAGMTLVFIMQKCFIPYIIPFKWDPALAALDKALHFGRYPHEIITPFAEKLGIVRLLDISYFLWYAALYFTTSWCLFCDRDLHRRMQYLWAFVLVSILLGMAGALALSSVGPVFFGDFYPALQNPYAPMVAHLAEASKISPIGAFDKRQLLIEWVKNDKIIDLNSISAMPSMHVATIYLGALYARKVSRPVFALLSGLAVLVSLGAVYTGYHYAIDIYVSLAAVSLIWIASGAIARRLNPGILLPAGQEGETA